MSDVLTGALLGFGGSLIVAFVANFCAEDYRRHRDSVALAASLAGELASYEDAWPLLRSSLVAMHARCLDGNTVSIPKMPKPTDRVFDANVGKIGLLGPKLAEDLAYVYNQINAFREMFKTLMDESALSAEQQAARLWACMTTLDWALERGQPLPDRLRAFAEKRYFPFAT
jgi:hypothetical protein